MSPSQNRCPHSAAIARVFGPPIALELPVTFEPCSRFEAVGFEVTDFHGRSLGRSVTCRHLGASDDSDVRGPWYPTCAIGGPPDFPLAGRSVESAVNLDDSGDSRNGNADGPQEPLA